MLQMPHAFLPRPSRSLTEQAIAGNKRQRNSRSSSVGERIEIILDRKNPSCLFLSPLSYPLPASPFRVFHSQFQGYSKGQFEGGLREKTLASLANGLSCDLGHCLLLPAFPPPSSPSEPLPVVVVVVVAPRRHHAADPDIESAAAKRQSKVGSPLPSSVGLLLLPPLPLPWASCFKCFSQSEGRSNG